MDALVMPGHLTIEVGQTIYARWRDPDKPEGHPDQYWFDPWGIAKVGPRRVLVVGNNPNEYGYARRSMLEKWGFSAVYTESGSRSFAAVYTEWSEDYLRHRLRVHERLYGQYPDPNTLGGQITLDRRIEALVVLGLLVTADDATVKARYRALARQFHPDVNKAPEATEQFLRIQQAYETYETWQNPSLGDLLVAVLRKVQEEQARRARAGDSAPKETV